MQLATVSPTLGTMISLCLLDFDTAVVAAALGVPGFEVAVLDRDESDHDRFRLTTPLSIPSTACNQPQPALKMRLTVTSDWLGARRKLHEFFTR